MTQHKISAASSDVTQSWDSKSWVALGVVVAGAAARLLPHLPNATPIGALALFAGAKLSRNGRPDLTSSLLIVFASMFLSDLVIGFNVASPFVYLALAGIVGIGTWVGSKGRAGKIACGALLGSILFFVVSNLGVWLLEPFYPKTLAGLQTCFVAAIPFFRNTILGDLAYSGVLFGTYALLVSAKSPKAVTVN